MHRGERFSHQSIREETTLMISSYCVNICERHNDGSLNSIERDEFLFYYSNKVYKDS